MGRGALGALISVTCSVGVACSDTSSHETTSRDAARLITSQQIAVPAYFSDWSDLVSNVPPTNVIIMNPDNGPASGYESELEAAHAAGARVLGYVYTKYANTHPDDLHGGAFDRTVAAVEADVDAYYSLYPSLDGIFEDEVTSDSDCTDASGYYSPIYSYIKNNHPGSTVVINPGTTVDTCYLAATDIAVTFEDDFATYQNGFSTSGRDWETPDNAGRVWHIIHTTSSSDWSTALDLSRQRNAGYVFVTSFTDTENTYGALPSYFDAEAANVNAYNAANGGSGGGGSGGSGSAPALSRWRGSNDGTNNYYSMYFSQAFTYYRVYIDTDESAATGFAVAGIGADYLIENGVLYSHGAPGWNWNSLGSSSQVLGSNSSSWTIPRATLGQTANPNSDQLSFEAETLGDPIQNAGAYEHVYSASDGAIVGYYAENDATNVYYTANFTQDYTFKHVFIDADTNPATGYAWDGIGADFMIENDMLYQSTGSGWSWTAIASAPATGGSTGVKTWTVPRATIGETASSGETANLVFDGSGGPAEYTAPVYLHVYTQ
jgi:hypothetical protein